VFFVTVADTLREILGADWTDAIGASWREMLDQMHWFATHPDQMANQTAGMQLA
jgi:hypothetical protein